MTVNELIFKTKASVSAIKKEHRVLTNFQRANPHLVEGVLNQMKLGIEKHGDKKLPTFDSLLKFKTDFLVDDMAKIYSQILKSKDQECHVFFYKIVPEFYQEQINKGFNLGDVDDLGYIVTGSNLVIENTVVKRDDFLYHYYATCN